jgi:transcriptional regulator with XRE-family HTH domain
MKNEKFITARKAAGLTQAKLADKAGVNISLIAKIEIGDINPANTTAKNLIAIAKALNVNPEDLI